VPVDESRESARPPTIIGLILSTKDRATPCTRVTTGTHEVICPVGTIGKRLPSTARTATS
jgi:hypothetical protein